MFIALTLFSVLTFVLLVMLARLVHADLHEVSETMRDLSIRLATIETEQFNAKMEPAVVLPAFKKTKPKARKKA